MKYILSIDQSTSGTKAIIFDDRGSLVHRCTLNHTQYYPNSGWVEHDGEEIYEKTLQAISNVIAESGVKADAISSIAITNQRETVIVWDKTTGKPVYNAIVWQCQRAEEICKEIKRTEHYEIIKEKTGLVLSPYFSAAKVKWILDNVTGARECADAGNLLMGTMDSWLIWKLTGGRSHVTDHSNASRTQLFNIKELKWDEEILKIFTIPAGMLPEVKFSDEIFGFAELGGLIPSLPISGVMGDSHAALFGQNCFKTGMAKATYGSGSSIMMNIGRDPKASENGLVTSIAWGMKGSVDYVFEGNINSTGATIKWLCDSLEILDNAKDAEKLATSIDNNDGVYLVPAFTGLGAPYWNSDARAMISGMAMGTTKNHIVRAALESIAYQIKDITDLMISEAEIKLMELRVDGGPTRNNFLMQFQADMLNIKIVRSKIEELSALGSAYMAGLGTGIFKNLEEIESLRQLDKTFEVNMNNLERTELYEGWKKAVNRALS